jgi:membrane-bound lytic murein transglycosylase B
MIVRTRRRILSCPTTDGRVPVSFRRFALIAVSALLLVLANAAARANDVDFATWLAGVRKDALERGIRPAVLDHALSGLSPIPRVLELDHAQPERVLGFVEYLKRVVNPTRVATAQRRLAENRKTLSEIGAKYGVQPRFIVALWGIESDFGQSTGGFSVIGALATLAYDGRRADFFRSELLAALKIIDEGDVTPEAMTGSWAGAMGQSQFMPSSFLTYAVDYHGDGRRDIWTNREDVFASIANYLAKSGWHGDQNWGRAVRLPPGFDPALVGLTVKKPLAEWRRLGLRRADGGPLPVIGIDASVVLPSGPDGPAELVYDNFRTILKWNNSLFFASAVGSLADQVEGR